MNIFLTSALVGGEWSASRPCRFTPGERAPRYPFYRRLGGPQSRCGRHGEVPTGTQTPSPLVVQPVASRYTDWAIPAPFALWIEIFTKFHNLKKSLIPKNITNFITMAIIIFQILGIRKLKKKRRLEVFENFILLKHFQIDNFRKNFGIWKFKKSGSKRKLC
jgi:hypothetical protein